MSIGTVFEELLGKPDTMSWDVISHLGLEMARKCQKLHGCGWDLELTAIAASEPCRKEFSNRGFMKTDCEFKWRLSYKVARQKRVSREAIVIVLTKYCGGPQRRRD